MRPVSKLKLGAVVLVAGCIAVVSAAAGMAAPAGAARASRSNPASPAAQTHLTQAPRLVWSDEFNGPAGSQPSSADWGNEIGRVRNHEAQYYTNRTQNEREDGNGHLVIEARRESYKGAGYTSASLTTAKKFKYGRLHDCICRSTLVGRHFCISGPGSPRSGQISYRGILDFDISLSFVVDHGLVPFLSNACLSFRPLPVPGRPETRAPVRCAGAPVPPVRRCTSHTL